MEPENWYLQNKPRIMREVKVALPHFRKLFVKAYGKDAGEAVARETMQRFEVVHPLASAFPTGDASPLPHLGV